jgi:Stathmin family
LRINFQFPLLLAATEIRCQEKSKGGLRYEVILAEPNLNQVPVPKAVTQNAAPKPSTAEEIAEKLRAAEERRLVRNLFAPSLTFISTGNHFDRIWKPRRPPTGMPKSSRLRKPRGRRTN